MSKDVSHAHRIRIERATAHVRVSRDGVELANSKRPVVLHEGSLPARYYLPPDDVRMELLQPSSATSHCPFKGDATYWSMEDAADIAWTYPTPIAGAEQIAGLVCFYNEKVDLEVDGQQLERPRTRWS